VIFAVLGVRLLAPSISRILVAESVVFYRKFRYLRPNFRLMIVVVDLCVCVVVRVKIGSKGA
jgi:hypothetical protein